MTWNARAIAEAAGLTNVSFERCDESDTLKLLYGWVTIPHGVIGQPDVRARAGSIVIGRHSTEAWFLEQVAQAQKTPGATAERDGGVPS